MILVTIYGIFLLSSGSTVQSASMWDDEPKILFPISDNINWTPLVPSEIECNFLTRTQPLSSYFEIPAYLPVLKKEYEISGFMCSSLTLSTRCEKGFFGGEHVTFIEEHHRLYESECVEGVKRYIQDSNKLINYPAPSCSWLKTSIESESFIVVHPYQVTYDPYNNQAVSELFVGGRCNTSYCRSIYEYKGWLADHHKAPECLADHLDTSLFYVKPHSDDLADFWSPDINIPSGHKICTMDYCGMEGLKFHDGSWVGIKRSSIPRGTDPLNSFFVNLPECPEGEHLSLVERYHTEHIALRTELEEFFQTECQKTKMSLIEGNPISRVSLQSLTPSSPGRHRVYRYVNGTVEMGISDYKEVSVIPPITGNPVIVKTSMNKTIRWKYWTHDERFNIYDGPNGLFIFNGSVMSYTSGIREYRKALGLSMKFKVPIEYPTLFSKSSEIKKMNGTYKHVRIDDSNLGDVLSAGAISLGQSILRYGILIAALLSVVAISLCAIPRLVGVIRRRTSEKGRIPMVYYRP